MILNQCLLQIKLELFKNKNKYFDLYFLLRIQTFLFQNQKDESDKLLSDIMFELQKPKTKPTCPPPQPSKIESKPNPPPPQPPKIQSKPVEIPSLPEENKSTIIPPSRQENELDWGDDDSMSFDAVSKLMNDPVPTIKPLSPPRVSKSLIQFDTQELEFVTDEQLLKSSRTFHTSPSKETDQNENINKDECLRLFWFDAYEDSAAQPGKIKTLTFILKNVFVF